MRHLQPEGLSARANFQDGAAETVRLTRGRQLLTGVLQSMAPHTADEAVKKGGSGRRASAPIASATRGTPRAPSRPSSGPITVTRVDFTGFAGGVGRHPADARLGLDGLLATHATRLIGLAGGQRSFANANRMAELCGLTDSDRWADSWNAARHRQGTLAHPTRRHLPLCCYTNS